MQLNLNITLKFYLSLSLKLNLRLNLNLTLKFYMSLSLRLNLQLNLNLNLLFNLGLRLKLKLRLNLRLLGEGPAALGVPQLPLAGYIYIYTSHKKTQFFAISRGSLKFYQI